MSNNVTSTSGASSGAHATATNTSPINKGKNKTSQKDQSMEEEEEEEEDDDEEEEEEEEEEEGEDAVVHDDLQEIDPSAIRTRRTRGVKVDYTSAAALAKAGLAPETHDDEDDSADDAMKE